jgi:hypothetical protein
VEAGRAVRLERDHEGAEHPLSGYQRRRQGSALHPAHAERLQGDRGLREHGEPSAFDDVPELACGVQWDLDVLLSAARRGHPQALFLENDHGRGLVADHAPHLVEDRRQRSIPGEAAHERPRDLVQALVQQPAIAFVGIQPHVLQRDRGRPRQCGQRQHVLVDEASRLVDGVEQPEHPAAAAHGNREERAHTGVLDRRVVQRIGTRVVAEIGLARLDHAGGRGRRLEAEARHSPARGRVARPARDQLSRVLVVEGELAGFGAHGRGCAAAESVVGLAHILLEDEQR